jgi:glucose/arabinose dehydrogenase
VARLITVKAGIVALVIFMGCRGEGRAPDRPPVHPRAGSASTGSGGETGAAPVARDTKLVTVPADVVKGVELAEMATGLERPVLLTFAPGDARKRLFIVEQHSGKVRVMESGKLAAAPFLTIGGLSTGNEQGLLGLAFHPSFATNGKLYVNYTTKDKHTHVVEFRVTNNPDAVDMTTKRELATIQQPYSNHNGGHVEFGPDGKLYTGMGDGGAANDPHDHAQNKTSLLGKLLRFDVDAEKPTPEIVHMGLRNPWRFAFDRQSGGLYIGDVGQNLWESVHVVAVGDGKQHNFGWNVVEGSHCFDRDTGAGKATCKTDGFTLPVAEYPHEQGCSITGGRVYRGKALPSLTGRYFYADYCTGLLRSFSWQAGSVREHWDWKPSLDKKAVLTQISSFGEDHDGELYIVELTGSIYRLVPAN